MSDVSTAAGSFFSPLIPIYGKYMDEHGADEVFDLAPTKQQLANYPAESKFYPDKGLSRADQVKKLQEKASQAGIDVYSNPEKLKKAQNEVIQKINPMRDNYHAGIRSEKDIKTWAEAIQDSDSFVWGDFTKEQAEEALKK